MTNQPNPTATELAARLRECSAQPDCPFALGLEIGTAADELERLAAEVAELSRRNKEFAVGATVLADKMNGITAEIEELNGIVHQCPKCGEFCKQCRCWNDELAEARALILEGGFDPRQRADDYHLRRDAFLARTATGEGEQRTALRSQIIRTDHGNSFRVLSLPDAQFGGEGVANVVWVAGPASSRELWHWGVPEKMLGGEGDEAAAMSAATEWLLDMTTRGEQP
jgi:hypothetical protein